MASGVRHHEMPTLKPLRGSAELLTKETLHIRDGGIDITLQPNEEMVLIEYVGRSPEQLQVEMVSNCPKMAVLLSNMTLNNQQQLLVSRWGPARPD